MGKKSKQKEAERLQQQNQQMALQDRQKADASTQQLNARIAARRAAIDKKDFANAPDFIGNTSLAAKANQQIENNLRLTDTGVGGLSMRYADPNQVAIAKTYAKDKMAENAGMQYEADMRDYIGQTQAMENQQAYGDRAFYADMSRSASDMAYNQQRLAAQIQMQRSSWLPQVVGMGIQGGMMALTGGMSAGGMFAPRPQGG